MPVGTRSVHVFLYDVSVPYPIRLHVQEGLFFAPCVNPCSINRLFLCPLSCVCVTLTFDSSSNALIVEGITPSLMITTIKMFRL